MKKTILEKIIIENTSTKPSIETKENDILNEFNHCAVTLAIIKNTISESNFIPNIYISSISDSKIIVKARLLNTDPIFSKFSKLPQDPKLFSEEIENLNSIQRLIEQLDRN